MINLTGLISNHTLINLNNSFQNMKSTIYCTNRTLFLIWSGMQSMKSKAAPNLSNFLCFSFHVFSISSQSPKCIIWLFLSCLAMTIFVSKWMGLAADTLPNWAILVKPLNYGFIWAWNKWGPILIHARAFFQILKLFIWWDPPATCMTMLVNALLGLMG